MFQLFNYDKQHKGMASVNKLQVQEAYLVLY
jgi:hypothetical protein